MTEQLFDVFLAHSSVDKPQVRAIATKLREQGIKPWLDEEQIHPGKSFQEEIQKAIPQIKAAAIIIGTTRLGKWQIKELRSLVSEFFNLDIPVIPVLLPGVNQIPDNLLFLQDLNSVDFENIDDTKAFYNLQWGITQVKPDLNPKTLQLTAEEWFNLGNNKRESGDNQGAIADYDQAIQIKPDYAEAFKNRGNAKSNLGDYQGAIADYDQAIQIKPDYALAYNNRGNAKKNLGDNPNAIADYDQAIKIKPDYASAYINRGLAKKNLGDKQGAIANYNQAIKIKPDYTDAYSSSFPHILPASSDKTIKNIRIFLASSAELESDREQFEIFISRKNREYIKKEIFLELVIWEDFLDAMSATRLQDEYNKAIAECDIFVSLFHTKVGKYTEEEFFKAFATFKENNKPFIYTYFKDTPISMSKITSEILSLLNFREKLRELGHFYTIYSDVNDLKYKFDQQLIKLNPHFEN
jgi:tetratricopeptide (TPR) repeat protein